MRPCEFSLQITDWPQDIRSRFETTFADAPRSQVPRLRQAMGRWLKLANDDDLPPELITPALIEARSATMSPELATAMKRALQGVFPDVPVFLKPGKVVRTDDRILLREEIRRNWDRFPAGWQPACESLLHISEDGLDDGRLVEAWAVSGLKSRLQAAWAFFDFCRENELPFDVVQVSVKARLRMRQEAFRSGDVSLAHCHSELQRLHDLTRAVFPERDLGWMKPAMDALKKKAKLEPTRNSGRIVDIAELRAAAIACGEVADRSLANDSGHWNRRRCLKLARTGLAISLLLNSPIRRTSLARLDLERHFDEGLTTLYLSATETKDKSRDVRMLSPEIRQQLSVYLKLHRRYFAPVDERSLFVGAFGKPIEKNYLTQSIGDLTESLFGKRVTPHVIRNIIAGFIVSEAPEQAPLAGEVLNHAMGSAQIETYRSEADQITAGAQLRKATDAARAKYASSANTSPKSKVKPPRGRRPVSRRYKVA